MAIVSETDKRYRIMPDVSEKHAGLYILKYNNQKYGSAHLVKAEREVDAYISDIYEGREIFAPDGIKYAVTLRSSDGPMLMRAEIYDEVNRARAIQREDPKGLTAPQKKAMEALKEKGFIDASMGVSLKTAKILEMRGVLSIENPESKEWKAVANGGS
jgi:hypothetical protein